jgi:hypothetical protein
VNRRSAGIKDLGFGLDGGSDPGSSTAVPPPDVRHHFVAGVITADPAHPFGIAVGDLMVRPASGAGPPHLEPANVVVLGGVHHFDFQHDPAVLERVLGWLDPIEPPATSDLEWGPAPAGSPAAPPHQPRRPASQELG